MNGINCCENHVVGLNMLTHCGNKPQTRQLSLTMDNMLGLVSHVIHKISQNLVQICQMREYEAVLRYVHCQKTSGLMLVED